MEQDTCLTGSGAQLAHDHFWLCGALILDVSSLLVLELQIHPANQHFSHPQPDYVIFHVHTCHLSSGM